MTAAGLDLAACIAELAELRADAVSWWERAGRIEQAMTRHINEAAAHPELHDLLARAQTLLATMRRGGLGGGIIHERQAPKA
jgi:hypothetical protein